MMVTILRHLDRTRFEPHLVLVNAIGPYIGDVPSDVVIHDLRLKRARYALVPMIRAVSDVRPAVILSTLGYLNLLLVGWKWLLPGKPKLAVREATVVSSSLSESGYSWNALQRALYRWLYPHADAVICQSQGMLEDLRNNFGVPDKLLRLIPNPVDHKRIEQLALSSNVQCFQDGPNILALGRLVQAKGFDILLEAFAQIVSRIPSAHLWVLGEGPLKEELQRTATELGVSTNFHLLPFQQNPYIWMKQADVVVQSSRSEGLPNVLLEACALGKHVVALDCPGGTRDILSEPGLGVLVKGSAIELANNIVAVLNDKVPLLSAPERIARITQKFGICRVIAQYEDLLTEMAQRPRMNPASST